MSSDYDKAGPLFRFKHLPQKSREIPPPWTEHTLVGEGEAREKFQRVRKTARWEDRVTLKKPLFFVV